MNCCKYFSSIILALGILSNNFNMFTIISYNFANQNTYIFWDRGIWHKFDIKRGSHFVCLSITRLKIINSK